MNYLIQAFACSPYRGGEYAVSWGWISHLDRIVKEEDIIYVVSLTLTEKDILDFKLSHVRLLSVPGMKKWNFLNYNAMYYKIWQRMAYRMVKASGIKIDVCHIYSLSDFRQPGDWWKLNCKTIFGPVGGGQVCPVALCDYDDKSAKLRTLVNLLQPLNPIFKRKIDAFYKVYSCNYETRARLNRGSVLPDVPLNDRFVGVEIEKNINDTVTILSVGRLINKKGILLLLDVLSLLATSAKWQCLIYGEGEQKEVICERIKNLKLQDKVYMMGAVQYAEITEVYKKADIFVLPSLRESGGSVLVEAAAHGLPVVALKMSLAEIFSRHNAGLFVNTKQGKSEIMNEFADKIRMLIEDEGLRKTFGENGYDYVNSQLNWNQMLAEVYGEWI